MNEKIFDETKPQITVVMVHETIKVTPNSILVKVDCNPIARYNHAIKNYMQSCNKIQGIQPLSRICCPFLISWLYDWIIYFYTLFFKTITCLSQVQRGWLYSLIMAAIYLCLLILPIISPITFAISALFFLYYVAGLIVCYSNRRKLGTHQFTQNMVPQSEAPPFPDYENFFFLVESEQIIAFYHQHTNLKARYQTLITKGQFMAYTQDFLDNQYYYIHSSKMIVFHIAFLIVSVAGFVLSVKIFPKIYHLK